MNILKQLSKDSLIYGIGGGLSRCFPFLLLPLYTRIFNKEEFGNIEFIIVITSLISAVIVLGMDSAQSYFFFEQKKSKKKQAIIISSILQWKLFWGLIIISVSAIFTPLIINTIFDHEIKWYHYLLSFSHGFLSCIMMQSIEVLRLLYKPVPYVIIGLVNSVIAGLIILLFIVILDYGILGYFLGNAIASLFMAIVGWIIVRDYINFEKLHYNLWPNIIKFGAPLLPAELAYYGMSTSDKWMVKLYHESSELALYAVAAKFALIFTLIIETFRKAWWPIAMESIHSNEGIKTFRYISIVYTCMGVSCLLLLQIITPFLLKIFAAEPYHNQWPIISILFWQSFFYGFYLIGSAGIWKLKKTYLTSYMMCGAAILNLILNYLLVPDYGGMGAAISTAISYMIWIFAVVLVSESLWRINFPILRILSTVIIGILVTALNIEYKLQYNNALSILSFTAAIIILIPIIKDIISIKSFFK